jgi:NAD+ synthase
LALATNILNALVNLDYGDISTRIKTFISQRVNEAGADGITLGLSGGVDSTVVAHLSAMALPKRKVLGLILPDSATTPRADVRDAEDTARSLGIETRFIEMSTIRGEFMKHLETGSLAEGNLRARIRMCLLYYHANISNRIVLGTGDRSEILIGYYTKYGDGGVDVLPIGGLYKSQVRMLAKAIEVPDRIADKPSSPHLWSGQTAEGELGLSYEVIDPVLHLLFDRKLKPEDAARQIEDSNAVARVLEMHRRSQHKRTLPGVCPIPPPASFLTSDSSLA